MSHFFTIVLVDKKTVDVQAEVNRLLAPYREYDGPGTVPENLLAFEDIEDASRLKYETESSEMVRLADGRLLSRFDEFFNHPQIGWVCATTFKIPPGATVTSIPFTEIHKTFDEYMTKYEGHNGRDSKTGRYGFWTNPNGYYDYWIIGGRWDCALIGKKHRHRSVDNPFTDGPADTGTNVMPADLVAPDITAFAVVTPDGAWCANGRMGWFGCSHGESVSADEWATTVRSIIAKHHDCIAVAVDCHV